MEFVDLVALSKADESKRSLDLNSREVFQDPHSRERLVDAGMISEKGEVTDAGMNAIKSIRKREALLKEGIPFSDSSAHKDPKRLSIETTEPWLFIMIGKDQIVTNGEILFTGKPEVTMKANRADTDLQKDLVGVIKASGTKMALRQVWPHSFQAFSFGGVEIVWLADEKQELVIPIQSKYIDFINHRFPKATFWGSNEENPIQAKVRGKGVKNSVVALVATFCVANQLKKPKKLKEWRNEQKMSEDSVPPLEDEGRSSLREREEE